MIRLSFLLILTSILIGCNPDDTDPSCYSVGCDAWGFAVIERNTFENLMGINGQPYHPDSIRVTANTGNEIFFETGRTFGDNWELTFNYHDALKRCDLHEMDSVFSLFFYLYLNENDSDTIEFQIAPCQDYKAVLFNGDPDVSVPDGVSGYTSFFLRK